MNARYPDGTEQRSGGVEIRAVGRRLEGYAATFGNEARIGGFTESIRPGAFKPRADTLALFDHDATRLLARTSNGSLRLSQDSRGLHFSLDVPPTSTGADALAMVEARLAGGMSFGFVTNQDAWPAPDRRELISVDLLEIS